MRLSKSDDLFSCNFSNYGNRFAEDIGYSCIDTSAESAEKYKRMDDSKKQKMVDWRVWAILAANATNNTNSNKAETFCDHSCSGFKNFSVYLTFTSSSVKHNILQLKNLPRSCFHYFCNSIVIYLVKCSPVFLLKRPSANEKI